MSLIRRSTTVTTRVAATFVISATFCCRNAVSGYTTSIPGRPAAPNIMSLSDAALGGAIAAAVGGFAVLLIVLLILIYLVRIRCRRRRKNDNTTSSSTFTYDQQFSDDSAALSGTQSDPTRIVPIYDGRHRSPIQVIVANDDPTSSEADDSSDRTSSVFVISGSSTRRKSRLDVERSWPPLEPGAYFTDRQPPVCSVCRRPWSHSADDAASCRCDRAYGDRFYGYGDNDATDFTERGAARVFDSGGGRRPRRDDDDDVNWRIASYARPDDDELVRRRPSPIAPHSRSDFTMLSTAFLGTDRSHGRRPTPPPRATPDGPSTTDPHIYARIERRASAGMTAVELPRRSSGSSRPRTPMASDRSSGRRSAHRRRRRSSTDGRTATHTDAEAVREDTQVDTTSTAVDGQAPASPEVVRTRLKTTTRRTPTAGGSGRLSAEYCTRVVDEAFGAIVNPVFEMEMN